MFVNKVGVEVNSASTELLSYVAGLGPVLAANIVRHRQENGAFSTRKELLKVPRLGQSRLSSVLVFTLSTNLLFYNLLKAPTTIGRKVMDELEGLKLFLSVAEKDRLNVLNPPDKTPALFERFLPWALALGVEQQWCEQFSEILKEMGRDEGYAPLWYNSSSNFSSQSFASSLGNTLSATISSSSRAPGSSSGSGGGGSSGGGGGGGGGGGW